MGCVDTGILSGGIGNRADSFDYSPSGNIDFMSTTVSLTEARGIALEYNLPLFVRSNNSNHVCSLYVIPTRKTMNDDWKKCLLWQNRL